MLQIACAGAGDLISWRCWHSGLEFLMSGFSPTPFSKPVIEKSPDNVSGLST
jgi:hypothetical protein